jgi:hypothetical protein
MVLNEESGIDGKNLAAAVELNAVAGPNVAFACKVCYKLILEPANGDEGCRVVRHKILSVDGALKDAAVLVDGVLGIRYYRDPSSTV